MRADRLLSLLMLLQSRGRLTARQLADELEVSERTVYRDVDALSAAGVPVYAERGPDGGFALLDSYRTDLTGLTEEERRALFLLSTPSALADLGLREPMAAALRKLSAALPAARRDEELRVRRRFYLDSSPWLGAQPATAHLRELQQAAWEDRRVDIAYRLPSGPTAEQRIDVYGLVAKEGVWYVLHVREGRVQAHRVADLVVVRLLDERFARPPDFDLRTAWEAWCAAAANRPGYHFTLRVAPSVIPWLPQLGVAATPCEDLPPDAEGRRMVAATCESFEDARARVLALGAAVEVIAPEPLRRGVIDYAEQIAGRYLAAGEPRL